MEGENKTRTGLIHLYCGDGKGKTTCGVGLCVRAAGAGLCVMVYQFLKDNSSSERRILERIPDITLVKGPERMKFSFQMTEEEKHEQRTRYDAVLRRLFDRAAQEQTDLLFLDEAVYAVRCGLLDEALLLDCLDRRPERLEVILTGREPGSGLLRRADYVTEMRKVRHPYDSGIAARRGIER